MEALGRRRRCYDGRLYLGAGNRQTCRGAAFRGRRTGPFGVLTAAGHGWSVAVCRANCKHPGVLLSEHIERAIVSAAELSHATGTTSSGGRDCDPSDEFTRKARKGGAWRAGIHQAVEAPRKGANHRRVRPPGNGSPTSGTFSCGFLTCGMTGTALPAAAAADFIACGCCPFPQLPQQRDLPDCIFAADGEKWSAIVERAGFARVRAAVLIGAVDRGLRRLSAADGRRGPSTAECPQSGPGGRSSPVPGRRGSVTVATNMAGRGTDIKLGDRVMAAGGAARHRHRNARIESHRIDRRLAGAACGRQRRARSSGFLSLEDELLRASGRMQQPRSLRWKLRAAGESGSSRVPIVAVVSSGLSAVSNAPYRDGVLLQYAGSRQRMLLNIGQGSVPGFWNDARILGMMPGFFGMIPGA